TGGETGDVQAAGAHRFDLGAVGLHGEEADLFAGHVAQVLQERVPDVLVDGGVLYRGVGKEERVRVDELGGIGWRVGDQVAVGIAVHGVELPAAGASVLGQG